MRIPFALVALAALAAAAGVSSGPAGAAGLSAPAVAEAVSDQRKAKTKRQRADRAYGQGQRQIACTQFGCQPIPPGCQIRTGYNPFTWDPSGFDEVVCPYRGPMR